MKGAVKKDKTNLQSPCIHGWLGTLAQRERARPPARKAPAKMTRAKAIVITRHGRRSRLDKNPHHLRESSDPPLSAQALPEIAALAEALRSRYLEPSCAANGACLDTGSRGVRAESSGLARTLGTAEACAPPTDMAQAPLLPHCATGRRHSSGDSSRTARCRRQFILAPNMTTRCFARTTSAQRTPRGSPSGMVPASSCGKRRCHWLCEGASPMR